MKSDQAQVFGFPNPLMGIAEYGFLTTLGLIILGGARLNKRFWLAIEASVVGSILFIHWLLFESLYRIGTVCPYCLLTWLATIAIFVYTTLHIFKLTQTKNRVLLFLQRHPIDIIVLWYVIIFGLMLVKFWYYWSSLI